VRYEERPRNARRRFSVVTKQKQTLVELAYRYAPAVHLVVTRGGNAEVTAESDYEATLHADAELVVHMIADLLADYRYASRSPSPGTDG
jgi:hypothetical protein